jgi:hypothetical protein
MNIVFAGTMIVLAGFGILAAVIRGSVGRVPPPPPNGTNSLGPGAPTAPKRIPRGKEHNMKICDTCGAACCRFVVIQVGPMNRDQRWWANMRGRLEGDWFRIRSKCACLTADGRCSQYEDRPEVCRKWEIGGKMCMAARKALREMRDTVEPLETIRPRRGWGWLVKLVSR